MTRFEQAKVVAHRLNARFAEVMKAEFADHFDLPELIATKIALDALAESIDEPILKQLPTREQALAWLDVEV